MTSRVYSQCTIRYTVSPVSVASPLGMLQQDFAPLVLTECPDSDNREHHLCRRYLATSPADICMFEQRRVAQTLLCPLCAPEQEDAASGSCAAMEAKFNKTQEQLLELNPGLNCAALTVGQQVRGPLPAGAPHACYAL